MTLKIQRMREEYDFSQGQRGSIIPSPGKTRVTIMLDDDLVEFFRTKAEAQGTGYQNMINSYLREAMIVAISEREENRLLTVSLLRQVLREELCAKT